MAHFWVQDADSAWAVAPLEGDAYRLVADRSRPLRPRHAGPPGPDDVVVMRCAGSSPQAWCLMSGSAEQGLLVNGRPAVAGLFALADKDLVLRAGGGPLFFSTERLARVEPYRGTDASAVCPRCRQPIVVETPSVRCPGCDVWYHATTDLPCWTYSPTCSVCSHPSESDGRFRWTPEEL